MHLENGTLLMCFEASISATGASQASGIVASAIRTVIAGNPGCILPRVTAMIVRQDSGDWRGPWRQVTPGRMPIGWPQGREGNAEDPFFWRSKRGFHVLCKCQRSLCIFFRSLNEEASVVA